MASYETRRRERISRCQEVSEERSAASLSRGQAHAGTTQQPFTAIVTFAERRREGDMRISTRTLFTGRLGRIVLAALFSLFVVGASLGHERSARAASPITVHISVDSWVLQEIPMKKLAAEYTRLHPGVNIAIDTALDKWDTKALAEIKQSGHPLWDAHMVTTPFIDLDSHLAEGLFLPFDPYLAASPEKGARELKSAMIPSLLADGSRSGRLYSIPYSVEIV